MISLGLLVVVALQSFSPMVNVGGVPEVEGIISPLLTVFAFLAVLAGSFLAIESFR